MNFKCTNFLFFNSKEIILLINILYLTVFNHIRNTHLNIIKISNTKFYKVLNLIKTKNKVLVIYRTKLKILFKLIRIRTKVKFINSKIELLVKTIFIIVNIYINEYVLFLI